MADERGKLTDFAKLLSNRGVEECLLLSPHPDDIAFSISGAVRQIVERGGMSVRILVAFSKSAFTPDGQEDLSAERTEQVSARRRAEDEGFLKLFPEGRATMRWMDLEDSPLRGYPTVAEYRSGGTLRIDDLRQAAKIGDAAADWLPSGGTILAPLGIGAHIDHRITRQAALSLASERSARLFLYEDMPYTTEMEFGVVEDHIQDFAGRIGISLSPLIVGDEGTLEFKARSIDCYRSQVVTEERRGILNYARWLNENGAERLWEVEFGGHCSPVLAV